MFLPLLAFGLRKHCDWIVRPPNISLELVITVDQLDDLKLEDLVVKRGLLSARPWKPLWEGKSVAELVDKRDHTRVAREMRKILAITQRSYFFLRRDPAVPISFPRDEHGTFCLVEVTPDARDWSHLTVRIWHVSGWATRALLAGLFNPSPWVRFVAYAAAALGTFVVTYHMLLWFGQPPQQAVTGALLVSGPVLGLGIREAWKEWAQ
jgi:hypothetical protein